MDAFYASIEQRDFPEYRNKPVIVGGNPNSRGVVSTCSYEARKYGIHSAMSSSNAYRLCPHAIFLEPRFSAYKEASKHIRAIFYDYTDIVEVVSLDEAYLDVTNTKLCHGSATLIAKEIKTRIWEKLKLSSSAGVSYNKFIAKIASDYQKPNGFTLVLPEQGENFVKKLKIRSFHGIGPATEKKMNYLNIYTGDDLRKIKYENLKNHFGKFSDYLYDVARGIDLRLVNPSRERKSISKEITFANDIYKKEEAIETLEKLTIQVLEISKQQKFIAKTITLKLKYTDFKSVTRSQTKKEAYHEAAEIINILEVLLTKTDFGIKKVRLLGVNLSKLEKVNE